MRFFSIFTHEPVDRPPTEAEMASMGKLIEARKSPTEISNG